MYLDGPTRLSGSIIEFLLGTALPTLVTIRADYYQDRVQPSQGVMEDSCESMARGMASTNRARESESTILVASGMQVFGG